MNMMLARVRGRETRIGGSLASRQVGTRREDRKRYKKQDKRPTRATTKKDREFTLVPFVGKTKNKTGKSKQSQQPREKKQKRKERGMDSATGKGKGAPAATNREVTAHSATKVGRNASTTNLQRTLEPLSTEHWTPHRTKGQFLQQKRRGPKE
ncbi:uncharacterized protein SPSK_02026 [Sporothrix schenckii 1099-18]|uniref:Uncharacterized protein n=1 Tax=Sporothrix schenckii 1099-18 TaxID=1397361 RepID=A0A0F2MBP4_SPOSC|nr:uncharacterized protein SPSK_02026 [Sporothrix schenckii 1099-18]KJR87123.1 hypothetical protein SPSK_02026 [Sporothrix schenckii 1099-18]